MSALEMAGNEISCRKYSYTSVTLHTVALAVVSLVSAIELVCRLYPPWVLLLSLESILCSIVEKERRKTNLIGIPLKSELPAHNSIVWCVGSWLDFGWIDRSVKQKRKSI